MGYQRADAGLRVHHEAFGQLHADPDKESGQVSLFAKTFGVRVYALECNAISRYYSAVSTAEIIKQLPKLSEAERRAVRDKLLELARGDEDVRLCDEAAVEGARMLDQMEAEDVRGSQG